MNDSRVTAHDVRYRSGAVQAECECGERCEAEWAIERELVYWDDGESAWPEYVDVKWITPGCSHVGLTDLVGLVEDWLPPRRTIYEEVG